MSETLKQEDLDALFGALESGEVLFPQESEEDEAAVDQDALAEEWEKQLEAEFEQGGGGAAPAAGPKPRGDHGDFPRELQVLLGIELELNVVVGRANMFINEILQLSQGSLIELDQKAGSLLQVEVENKKMATGEPVITNERFGVRLKHVLSVDDRIKLL